MIKHYVQKYRKIKQIFLTYIKKANFPNCTKNKAKFATKKNLQNLHGNLVKFAILRNRAIFLKIAKKRGKFFRNSLKRMKQNLRNDAKLKKKCLEYYKKVE